jgi:hypothetical protein
LAAYAIRTLSFVMCQASLLMTCCAYVHSIMSCRIIFWASLAESNVIFKIKKRTVRIIMKARNKGSYCPLFRLVSIFLFYSQYIFSVSIFVVDIHNFHTRHGSDLHHPSYKWAKFQKGVLYSGITVFNNIPQNGKNLSIDASKFKYAFKKFLHIDSFYSLGGNILNGEQSRIFFHINDLYSIRF